MLTEIRCQSRTYPTSLLTIFLLPTHCTFEKFIHIAYLSACFISQMSTQRILFLLLLSRSHSLQLSMQTSYLKFLYWKLQFWSISKGRHFAIEHWILWADQVIILLFLPKELREICELQVSNLTSNWHLFESSLGIEFCSIRKLPVCLRLCLWFTLWRKNHFHLQFLHVQIKEEKNVMFILITEVFC